MEPVSLSAPVPFSPGTRRAVLLGLALGLSVLSLRVAGILTPFLWAIVVAYAFNPLVRALQRRSPGAARLCSGSVGPSSRLRSASPSALSCLTDCSSTN